MHQIITLYTLNLQNIVCQLDSSKAWKIKYARNYIAYVSTNYSSFNFFNYYFLIGG